MVNSVNLTTTPFPDNLPALVPWKLAYKANWTYHYAFATSVVTDAGGRKVLGSSGSGYMSQYDTAVNYHPELYLKFLTDCLQRSY